MEKVSDEPFIFSPYNSVNKLVTEEDIQKILYHYGLPTFINNFTIYKRAFIHKSYTKHNSKTNSNANIIIAEAPPDAIPLATKSYERLEFLGDGILEFIVKCYLYERFPKENEGFMAAKKIAIVKNESIGKIAYEMGLHKWLIISKHAEEKKIRTNFEKLGCLFESFIAAVFLNVQDIKLVQKFVINILEKHIDWIQLIQNDDNYKNILQVIIQKQFKITPTYYEDSHDKDTGFTMSVYICLGEEIYNMNIQDAIHIKHFSNFQDIHDVVEKKNGKLLIYLSTGIHKIKKKAEQFACNQAIQLLTSWNT
jgi:ribonuclease-3